MPSDTDTRTLEGGGRRSSIHAGLVWTLVRTDFKARYHGTMGGFVWALLKPLSMFIVLMGVFSFLFASNPTYKLDLIVGLFLWDFFAEGTKSGLTSLHARGYLLTKARVPSWILVITSISNAVVTLVVFCAVIALFLVGVGHPPTGAAFLAFLGYCTALMAIVVGFSLASSVLFLRYRDLNQVWEVVLQAGFFIAPIIYPLEILPERFHFYLYVWPPTPIIEFSRAVLVTGVMPTATGHLYLAADAAFCLLVGIIVFRWLSPRAAEYSVDVMPLIEVDAVSKAFWIPSVRRETVREHLLGLLQPRQFQRLQVLDGITFDVQPGEALGIMGRNGCGKSTLLKIVCGVYPPDRGRVNTRAAITPVLELGVGWNPELDAVDNVLLIGSVMGLPLDEIRRSMDEILAFAELERFANLKLMHYSSGMSARLGYAVAFKAVREVLVLDEIFAVGDAGFRARCEERYLELRSSGRTAIIVSHDPRIITTFCDRALLLDGGRILLEGGAAEVAARYVSMLTHATRDAADAARASS